MELRSPAFADGGVIPEKYTIDNGFDKAISPPLEWSNVPAGTRSFALVMEDLDVPPEYGRFIHWMLYNIPQEERSIAEGDIHDNAQYIPNSYSGYGMPQFECYGPPWPAGPHRYQFTLYAMKVELVLTPKSYDDLMASVGEYSIDSATLIGVYGPAKTPQPGG